MKKWLFWCLLTLAIVWGIIFIVTTNAKADHKVGGSVYLVAWCDSLTNVEQIVDILDKGVKSKDFSSYISFIRRMDIDCMDLRVIRAGPPMPVKLVEQIKSIDTGYGEVEIWSVEDFNKEIVYTWFPHPKDEA
jgi:hypothetical protein